jgi:hypothetical protein
MTKELNPREKHEIQALAKASAEALLATELFMRAKERKRVEAKASAN